MINRVILVGRLTKNPEIRKTPNGASICKFTLAVSRKVKAQGQPDADFISCVAFCLCNVWKYRYRALLKGGKEDMEKSDWYMCKYMELKKSDECSI